MQEGTIGNNDSKESLWLAHTANNRGQKSGKGLNGVLMSGYSSVSNKTPLSDKNNNTRANNARAGVLNVLTGGSDPTGGAEYWDGTDFLANGTSHAKFSQYKNISINNEDFSNYYDAVTSKYSINQTASGTLFNNSNNWSSKGYNFNTGLTGKDGVYYNLKSTGVQGQSIFWAPYR
jgi:hypothetical protein